MSNSIPTADSLDPQAGFTKIQSVAQAANDLRAAAGDKAREFAHSAEEKAAALKERAIDSAQQIRDTTTERAAQFKTAATDTAQHLRESATEQWQDTRVKAKELHVSAEDYIRQNPTAAVLTALGAGFIIGLIVRN